MDAAGHLTRTTRFRGWHIEILLAAAALIIAIFPTFLYFRDRADSRATAHAASGSGHVATAMGPAAKLYALKPAANYAEVVHLPSSPQWLVFALDFDPAAAYEQYGASIRGSDGQEAWHGINLSFSGPGKLVFVLPSSVLGQDDYTVFLKGQGNTGQLTPVAEYTFRTVN